NRKQAQTNETHANEARARALEHKQLAERQFYASQINLAQRDWEAGLVAPMLERLDARRPRGAEAEDLRGFEWHYLRRLTRRNQLTLRGHTSWIGSVNWTPDGTRLVTCSRDGTVRVWDARTGDQLRVLAAPPGDLWQAVLNPAGTRIAATVFR